MKRIVFIVFLCLVILVSIFVFLKFAIHNEEIVINDKSNILENIAQRESYIENLIINEQKIDNVNAQKNENIEIQEDVDINNTETEVINANHTIEEKINKKTEEKNISTKVTTTEKIENVEKKQNQVVKTEKAEKKETPKVENKTEVKVETKKETEVKQESVKTNTTTENKVIIPKCENGKHGVEVGNSNKWFNTKDEAIKIYDIEIRKWGDMLRNKEIDFEEYCEKCPSGYEIWTCPFCNKWTINIY